MELTQEYLDQKFKEQKDYMEQRFQSLQRYLENHIGEVADSILEAIDHLDNRLSSVEKGYGQKVKELI